MLDTNSLYKIIQSAGLDSGKISPVSAGHYNDSYYIDSKKGKFVLRIAPADDVPKLFYEVDMMRSEPAIHKIVRQKTNVPVPDIIHSDFGRKIIDRDFIIMEYMTGRNGPFSEYELGRYVRQLHEIKSDKFGYPDRAAPTGGSWPELFLQYVKLIFKDCLACEIITQTEYDDFLTVYHENKNVLRQCPASLLHLDLWSQNILTRDGRITAILDFDRGLYGDPELEFAVLDTYGYSTPDFFEGYGNPRPDGEAARNRQKLYIVYELIKYAFIRTARNNSPSIGRNFVEKCRRIIRQVK